jgi:hypothetical protein
VIEVGDVVSESPENVVAVLLTLKLLSLGPRPSTLSIGIKIGIIRGTVAKRVKSLSF